MTFPALALALAIQLPALADLAIPGHKDVVHQLSLDLTDAQLGWTFVAAPVRGFGGMTVIEDQVPFSFSGKYGTRLFALPPSVATPEEYDPGWVDRYPSSLPGVSHIGSVPWSHPVARILSHLAVAELDLGLDGGPQVLALEVVGHEQWTASGVPLDDRDPRVLLFGLSGLGLVGLVLLRSSKGAMA
ncbi:MAG: hypothetical protein P1V81_07790 [Planctomycetota bacterium]|nr:hypothetical protein [Planctomycetota bacterium]